jgi:conjugal transfer pilus assembly protein TraI
MPLAREHNILDELVQRSAALVIDRFLQASADRLGKPILGAHLERHLVDAMRRLVGTHAAWAPNAERSRIWLGSDGLFVVWPNAAADISKLLEADQLPSVPKSSATMLEVLLGAGIVQAQPDGKPLFTIRPPGARVTMEAVKLTDPAVVLVGLEHGPQPLAETLQVVPAQTGDAPVASPSPLKPTPAAPQPPEAVAGGSGAPGPRQPEEQDRRTGATAAPRTAVEGAQQLELQISPMEPAVVHRCAVAPAAPEPEGRYRGPTRIALEAPMRLAPRLRAVLVEILEASNAADGACRVQPTVDGLFIALAEFERRHIEPSRALRALSDARMIAKGAAPGSGTSTVRLAGQVHLGLTILPPFLSGWQTPDPA